MARPTKHRTEAPPVLTRFSPAELAALTAKAARAGMNRSQAVRAAVESWEPIDQVQSSCQVNDIRVEYDE